MIRLDFNRYFSTSVAIRTQRELVNLRNQPVLAEQINV